MVLATYPLLAMRLGLSRATLLLCLCVAWHVAGRTSPSPLPLPLLYKISSLVDAFDVIRGNSDKFFKESLLNSDVRI